MRSGTFFATIGALLLAGCGPSSDIQMRDLDQSGTISVLPSSSPDHSFVVIMKNTRDIGYNVDDKANRDAWALSYLRAQCPAGQVVGEQVIETGQTAFGIRTRTYAVRVRC